MGHDFGIKSRVHPKYKTKYRVGNWAEYDRALVQRGDVTLWISTAAIDASLAVALSATASEVLIACSILNAMTTLGRPESFAIDT